MRRKSTPAGILFLVVTVLTAVLLGSAFAPEAWAVKKRWTDTYDGETGFSDYGNGVAVGPDGSIFVGGRTDTTDEADNAWLRKYSPRGKVRWTKTFDGGFDNQDVGQAVGAGPDGSVCITGYSYDGGGNYELWVRKYSARGRKRWKETYDHESPGFDSGRGVAVAADGSVYVAGSIEVTDEHANLWLTKYSSAGKFKWTETYNGSRDNNDRAWAVAVGPNGSVYVTGHTTEAEENRTDVLVAKYSPKGKRKWLRTYDGLGERNERGLGVAVAPNGSVYVAGYVNVDGENDNAWLRKYTSKGRSKWTETYNNDDYNDSDQWRAVTVGPDGNVYVAGTTAVEDQGNDIIIRKYSPRGKEGWTKTFNNTGIDDDDGAKGVAAGPDGSVYVAGDITVDPPWKDIWVRKYK
jgi:uncharacterized delta-60 repeat protein